MAQHMQTKVVDVISKRPSQRRDIYIQMVLPWLRKKSELLKDMDKGFVTILLSFLCCFVIEKCNSSLIVSNNRHIN